eukprot:scaffold79182_cov51-Prasinocladus_malaysianus.AAC.9
MVEDLHTCSIELATARTPGSTGLSMRVLKWASTLPRSWASPVEASLFLGDLGAPSAYMTAPVSSDIQHS